MSSKQKLKNLQISPGSPRKGEPLYLIVGRIRKPHGLKGEMLLEVLSDFPERIIPGKEFFVGENHVPLVFSKIRHHNKGLIISVDGVDSIEDTDSFRNQMVYIPTDRIPELPTGEFYYHQLIGLKVFDEGENFLGTLDEILETGANDVFIIHDSEGKELLAPAIDSVLLKVDLENQKMIVSLQEWY